MRENLTELLKVKWVSSVQSRGGRTPRKITSFALLLLPEIKEGTTMNLELVINTMIWINQREQRGVYLYFSGTFPFSLYGLTRTRASQTKWGFPFAKISFTVSG